jgi:hypothetical protein
MAKAINVTVGRFTWELPKSCVETLQGIATNINDMIVDIPARQIVSRFSELFNQSVADNFKSYRFMYSLSSGRGPSTPQAWTGVEGLRQAVVEHLPAAVATLPPLTRCLYEGTRVLYPQRCDDSIVRWAIKNAATAAMSLPNGVR